MYAISHFDEDASARSQLAWLQPARDAARVIVCWPMVSFHSPCALTHVTVSDIRAYLASLAKPLKMSLRPR
jgi:hypothetical protein